MTCDRFLKQKLLILILLCAWGGLPYHLIQKIDFSKVITMPSIKIDHLIPINFDSVWIYHSWIFLPIAVGFLITHWELLKRFAWGMFAVNAVSFLVFLCVPTEAPRPTDLADAPLLYLWTVQMDEPTNACPSLHASVTILSTIYGVMVLGRFRWAWLWRAITVLWACGILWSTLATRQHVFIDIAIGSLLGAIVALVGLWPRAEEAWSRRGLEEAAY